MFSCFHLKIVCLHFLPISPKEAVALFSHLIILFFLRGQQQCQAVKIHSSAGVRPLRAVTRTFAGSSKSSCGPVMWLNLLRSCWVVYGGFSSSVLLNQGTPNPAAAAVQAPGDAWWCPGKGNWKMGYLVTDWRHRTQGTGDITRNQNIDVRTKLWFPRSVVSGCTEIRKPGNPISRNNSTRRKTGVTLIGPLEQRASETGGRFGKSARGQLLC